MSSPSITSCADNDQYGCAMYEACQILNGKTDATSNLSDSDANDVIDNELIGETSYYCGLGDAVKMRCSHATRRLSRALRTRIALLPLQPRLLKVLRSVAMTLSVFLRLNLIWLTT